MTHITKAVFPVAGLGTRFLPATKASPKEMLPIVDKPLIQYAVEEAIAAGIKDLIFITSHGKRSIEDHFDTNYELESSLKNSNKFDVLDEIKNIIPNDVNCIYVRQPEAIGLGHAVLCASSLINEDEHFAVILADDLIYDQNKLCLSQMIEQFSKFKQKQSIIAVESVSWDETDKYGIVSVFPSSGDSQNDNSTSFPLNSTSTSNNNIGKVLSIIEKPKPEVSPSNLAVVGRYILSGKIFNILRDTKPGVGGEIQLTDAIATLINNGVYAYQFFGKRYDCGNKLGYLQASVEFGLRHKKFGNEFKQYIQSIVKYKAFEREFSGEFEKQYEAKQEREYIDEVL